MQTGKGKDGDSPTTDPDGHAKHVEDIVPGHPSIEVALARLPGQRSMWNPASGRLLLDVDLVSDETGRVDSDALGDAVASAVRLIAG